VGSGLLELLGQRLLHFPQVEAFGGVLGAGRKLLLEEFAGSLGVGLVLGAEEGELFGGLLGVGVGLGVPEGVE
jgi:hypothetical protein